MFRLIYESRAEGVIESEVQAFELWLFFRNTRTLTIFSLFIFITVF